MIKVILKNTWAAITVLAALGGAVGVFFLPIFTSDDYALTLTLKSAEKLIENKYPDVGLTVAFNGDNVKSLYYTKLQLKNSGKRALTKEYIFEPMTIHVAPPNAILSVTSSNKGISFSPEKATITWNLLNPSETIDLRIYSTAAFELNSKQMIREVTNVNYINEMTNPPTSERIKTLKALWLVFFIVGIYMTADAMSVVGEDRKLQRLLDFINTSLKGDKINKQDFLDNLLSMYSEYYEAVPRLFLEPETLIQEISKVLDDSEEISGRFLEVARREALVQVMHGNLYTLRSINIVFGPLVVGICFVGSITYFFF